MAKRPKSFSLSILLWLLLLLPLIHTAWAEDYLGVVRSNATGRDFFLDVYEPPSGGTEQEPSPHALVRDVPLGRYVVDAASAEVDDTEGDELVLMQWDYYRRNAITIYPFLPLAGGDIGKPIASDSYIGRRNETITAGNFDGDPGPEVAVAVRKWNGYYGLVVYELPTKVGGDTGRAIAMDYNIGRNVTALRAGDFDDDGEDELVIVRRISSWSSNLQIYKVPHSTRGDIGTPIFGYNDIGDNVIPKGIAVGEFDGDPQIEIAVVRSTSSGSHSLELFDAPRGAEDYIGAAVSRYADLGDNVAALLSPRLSAPDDLPANQPPEAVLLAEPTRGPAPLEVAFDGSASSDADGQIAQFAWYLEDTFVASGETIVHTFDTPGEFRMTLVVEDDRGDVASAEVLIAVLEPEEPAPPDDTGTLLPEEEELALLVNQVRAQYNLPPLDLNGALSAAARRHSTDMAENNFLSHTGSDGSSPWDRMRDAGYVLYYGGENVAAGYPTPDAVMNGWMNSSGHRDNILGRYCDFGVGYAYESGSTYRHYWTLTFGCER